MKLIIDIDEAEYTTLSMLSEREKVNELSYYERAIANGTPYKDRPKGGWLSADDDHIKCSVCGEYGIHNDWYECNYYTPFCPNCGADMRGEKNG